MDSLIKRFRAVDDRDLRICEAQGVAYQKDMTRGRAAYDIDYLIKVEGYENTPIARAVVAGRCAMLERHLGRGASVLDIGAGAGAFVRAAQACGFRVCGFEIIPDAVERLNSAGAYSHSPDGFEALTFWDSLEHMDEQGRWLDGLKKGTFVFASIPVFQNLREIRASKHYRPGEHLYYWTPEGFVSWMALRGFRLVEQSAHEVDAGRESIGAFAFCRDLPDYHDHIALYREMHSARHYGSSATELHLSTIAAQVRTLLPASILDYGCGRSDLVAHFWLDGARRIARYDPAIPAFKKMPEGRFDLALCCDVLEHVPMASVDRVLAQVKSVADRAIFTISTKPSRAKLPDGRNAHVTLLDKDIWTAWIGEVFGGVRELPSQWEHELLLVAGGAPRETACARCGGEMMVDSFHKIGLPIEWFMRCRECGAMSKPEATEAAAVERFAREGVLA